MREGDESQAGRDDPPEGEDPETGTLYRKKKKRGCFSGDATKKKTTRGRGTEDRRGLLFS